ncbi:MAG: sigma-54-dependent Fis family transcriptional regulator [Oxalobacteraceae bacterium]|nr:MAG: sigma-54-dependent Fis family transcriptional regulator [Oxalobacteraceae bacterium]
MMVRKVMCVAPDVQPAGLDAQLRTHGWDVIWVADLSGARRLQAQLQVRLCLLLLERTNIALTTQIEAAVRSIADLEWVAAVPPGALELPEFRELLLDAFLDFHVGPIHADHLLPMLSHAHRRTALRASLREAPPASEASTDLGLIGRSPAMVLLRRQIIKLAATDAPVLIDGERGSGKELVAQAIHRRSARAAGPFVAADCSAQVPGDVCADIFGADALHGGAGHAVERAGGLLASAHEGTLFLDSVNDLPSDAQARLLRLLQERTKRQLGLDPTRPPATDARVIAASQVQLSEAVAQGRFREDLFDRLDVLTITVPPLRERKDDIVLLARHCLQRCAAEHKTRVEGFGRQAIDAMLGHDWPGNVRELFNRVQRAVVMTDRRLISPADLELTPAGELGDSRPMGLEAARTRAEREAIRLALARGGHNVSRAARELGISRMTLYRLMAKHRFSSDPS